MLAFRYGSETVKYKIIEHSVSAPKGFKATGVHCGIRKNKTKKDLALIYCDKVCNAAAVYTQNLVKGAPITVTKENLKNSKAQAIICNSGNANTCNADGLEKAQKMCSLTAEALKINSKDIIVASTGVIGQILPIEPIQNSLNELTKNLSKTGGNAAANAIMTTDTFAKEIAIAFNIGDVEVKIGGIAKGSGMIHPNMATMLAFVTTDVNISEKMLEKAIREVTEESFNMVSVDGDTSTNDMFAIMASGEAENYIIDCENQDYKTFVQALYYVSVELAKMLAKDGEGATKLLICKVSGANSKENAKLVAKSVICSNLLKAAMFGSDANWGRILCAIGYSGADIDIEKISVFFSSRAGEIQVCKNGSGIDFCEKSAKQILLEDEIVIDINLNDGMFSAQSYGCDLTYDYVKINGDYRT